jgi:hypothetical protein
MSPLSAEAPLNGGDETAEVDISVLQSVNLLRYANVLLLRAKSVMCPLWFMKWRVSLGAAEGAGEAD